MASVIMNPSLFQPQQRGGNYYQFFGIYECAFPDRRHMCVSVLFLTRRAAVLYLPLLDLVFLYFG